MGRTDGISDGKSVSKGVRITDLTTRSFVEEVVELTEEDLKAALRSLSKEERADLRQEHGVAVVQAKRKKDANPELQTSKVDLAQAAVRRLAWRTEKASARRTKRAGKSEDEPFELPEIEQIIDNARRSARVHDAILDLEDGIPRKVALLRARGLSFREIGEQLGVREDSCRRAFAKAVARVRRSLHGDTAASTEV